MISGDFFCNLPRHSCRISGTSIVPPYPVSSIINAAPVPSDRLGCVPLPVRPPASRAAGRDDWTAFLPI